MIDELHLEQKAAAGGKTMKVLLTGADGFIGRHVLAALQRRNVEIVAGCRRPENLYFAAGNTTTINADFAALTEVADWLPHLRGVDAVVNCVGIIAETPRQRFEVVHTRAPSALFKASSRAGVKKIVQISALGADASAQSAYHRSKKAADDCLRRLDLDWFVLQPSVVYGPGAKSMALFHALAALPVLSVFDGGRQKLQPVHVDDVAASVCRCLETEAPARTTLALVGPEALTFADLLKQLRRRLGKTPAPVLSLPARAAGMAGLFGIWLNEPAVNAETIAMLSRGNCADAEPFERFLGRPPLAFEHALSLRPASQAERWHAGLYFLRPALRLALAFMWLWSGWVSLFLFPHTESYRWLATVGIGAAAPFVLYSLALLDAAVGLALLIGQRMRTVIDVQLIFIA
ncbi:MAG: NAD(P)H-binding protein, partial [Gammaproteobacteria bacterium]